MVYITTTLSTSFTHTPSLLQDEYYPEQLVQKYSEEGLDFVGNIDDSSFSDLDNLGVSDGSNIFDGVSGGSPNKPAPTTPKTTLSTDMPSSHPSCE